MLRKTEEEIQAWAGDEKTKKGDKLVISDELTTSPSVPHVKVEVKKL